MSVAKSVPEPRATGTIGVGELRRKAVRGGTMLISSRLSAQLFSWMVTILVARLLRPYDYGVLTTGSLFLGLSDLLAEAGVGKALVQRKNLSSDDLAEGFSLSLGLSIVLYGVLFAIAGFAAWFFRNPDLVGYLRVAGLSLLIIPFRTVPLAVLEYRLQMKVQSVILVTSAVVQSILVLTLAVLGFGFWSLVAGTIASRLLEAAALTWQAGWVPRLRRPGTSTENLIPFGLSMVGTGLMWYFYSNADFAILGRLTDPVTLGYYAFAFGLISMPVQKLTSNCNQIAYPIFCRLQHDPDRVRNWFVRLNVLLGFVGFPFLVGMALVAGDAISVVLGDKWQPAVLPLRILSSAGLLMVVSYTLPPLFNSLGRPDITFKYMIVCVIVFPSGFALLGSLYGMVGVAMTWILFYPIVVAGLIMASRPITGLGLREFLAIHMPTLAALLVMSAAVLATQGILQETRSTALRLVVSIGVGVASYGLGILAFARKTVLAELTMFWGELKGA